MVGQKLREARLRRGESLSDVAARADISVATLSRIETTKQSLDLGTFLVLCKLLEVEPSDLISEKTANGNFVKQFATMQGPAKLEIWRALSDPAPLQKAKSRREEIANLSIAVEELLAQVDHLRSEVQRIRERVKKI